MRRLIGIGVAVLVVIVVAVVAVLAYPKKKPAPVIAPTPTPEFTVRTTNDLYLAEQRLNAIDLNVWDAAITQNVEAAKTF